MPFDVTFWIEYNLRIRRCRFRSFYTFVWFDKHLAKAEFLIFVFGLGQAGCSMVLVRRLAPSSRPLVLVGLCSAPCLPWPRRSRIGPRTSGDFGPFCQVSWAHLPLSYLIYHILCYGLSLFHRSKLWVGFQTRESFREFLSNLCRATLVYSRHTASRRESHQLASFWCMSYNARQGSKPQIWGHTQDFALYH